MATNLHGNLIVEFPPRCKPLPDGYRVIQLDSGYYLWEMDHPTKCVEGSISLDRWWVRRCAFAHHAGKI